MNLYWINGNISSIHRHHRRCPRHHIKFSLHSELLTCILNDQLWRNEWQALNSLHYGSQHRCGLFINHTVPSTHFEICQASLDMHLKLDPFCMYNFLHLTQDKLKQTRFFLRIQFINGKYAWNLSWWEYKYKNI